MKTKLTLNERVNHLHTKNDDEIESNLILAIIENNRFLKTLEMKKSTVKERKLLLAYFDSKSVSID